MQFVAKNITRNERKRLHNLIVPVMFRNTLSICLVWSLIVSHVEDQVKPEEKEKEEALI